MHKEDRYRIRLARENELTKLGEIEQRASQRFAQTAHAYVCGAPNLSLEILTARQRLGAVWVAADEQGELVGFAVAGELGGEAYLSEINVDVSHARQGIGRRLMAAVFEWARERSYPTLILSTFVDVAWNAPFYKTLGFEAVPETDLTPAMVETRSDEAKLGFLIDRRIFMRRSMRQPTHR